MADEEITSLESDSEGTEEVGREAGAENHHQGEHRSWCHLGGGVALPRYRLVGGRQGDGGRGDADVHTFQILSML